MPAAVMTIVDDDGALHAAAIGARDDASAEPLTIAAARPAIIAATRAWAAFGAGPDVLAAIAYRVQDLPGTQLADTVGTLVLIDATAAGWGWRTGRGATAGRMDLVTVLMHEIGHALGHDHHDGTGTALGPLMAPTLRAGERRALEPAHAHTSRSRALHPREAVEATTPSIRGIEAWTGGSLHAVPGADPVRRPLAAIVATSLSRSRSRTGRPGRRGRSRGR